MLVMTVEGEGNKNCLYYMLTGIIIIECYACCQQQQICHPLCKLRICVHTHDSQAVFLSETVEAVP